MDALAKFFQSLAPDENYRVVVAFLISSIGVLALLLLPSKFKRQRPNLVLGITIIALLLTVLVTALSNRWQWVAGLLPMLMVGYQLFYLWLYHPKETDGNPVAISPLTPSTETLTVQSYKRAQDSIESHFSLKTLFTRYGLPAVLLGITGILLSYIMVNPQGFLNVVDFTDPKHEWFANTVMRGIRLGALGAYVYVLLELGRRTFRHDITGALAMWCWVTLVLGPVLAATVAFLWRVPDAAGTTGWWSTGVILFFTGFAPRRVIAALEGAALQLLNGGTPSVVQTRMVPLTQIRGIGPEIEERLGEEGISDVNSLAASEPVRLVRNTSFDMRQILNWIDEAILMVTLPRGWQALEEEGITGAIDLAWYHQKIIDPNTGVVREKLPDDVVELASQAKMSNANLVATIQRLYEDTQVQYIWALYFNFTEFSGGAIKDKSKQPPVSDRALLVEAAK